MAENAMLHWFCWIHDEPEECAAGRCDLGYWMCPDCMRGLIRDGDAWSCPGCDMRVYSSRGAGRESL